MDTQIAWAALHAFGLQGRCATDIARLGSPVAALRGSPETLVSLLSPRRQKTVRGQDAALLVEQALARAALLCPFLDQGGRVLFGAALGRLQRAATAPLCVYALGNASLLLQPSAIGIVGARRLSDRGARWARRIAVAAAKAGRVVISGGAAGVDMRAHHAALTAEGSTVAVLGRPLAQRGSPDTQLEQLFAQSGDRALWLTESGPWETPQKFHFVRRNRLVAALCDSLVLVEGEVKSGARHTVKAANALEVPVYAVPGDPDDALAAAANHAIAGGQATALLDLEALFGASNVGTPLPLTPQAPPIVRALAQEGGRMPVDALAAKLHIDISCLWRDALCLELEGQVRREGDALVLS